MDLIMENIWNDFNLKKPPLVTLPAKYSDFVLKLHAAIDIYFSKHSQYEEEFNETAALLSRLLARRKNSFNKMKGFKDICKLNAALCRLLRVDFSRDLDNFRNTLPDVDYCEGTSVQLPTSDCLDYILFRLIAIHELYRRIINCCVSASQYFTYHIHLYFFFEISTLLLAVLAKIFSTTIKLSNLASDLYNNFLPYRLKLPINLKSNFLKDSCFEFPGNLETISSGIVGQEITVINQPVNKLLEQEEKVATVKAQKLKKTDVGKQVERTSNMDKRTFNIDLLNSAEEIKRFIAKENISRSATLNNSITSKILSHEWAGVTKLFERKIQKGEIKKAVNMFRKFLSLKIL